MLKFMMWQYRGDNNCWDYVRYWLKKEFNIPSDELPKFGAIADSGKQDKELFNVSMKKMQAMTAGKDKVIKYCKESNPVSGAIACKFLGDYLYHVGLVIGDKVYHVSRKSIGVSADTIAKFEQRGETRYYVHRSL